MGHFIKVFGPVSVCRHVRSLGFQPEQALQMAGLQPAEIDRPGGKIPAAAMFDLVEAASRVTGKPDFGLSWGMHTSFRRFGPLATFLSNCDSIRQCVTLSQTFLARHNWGIGCRIIEMGELSRVEFEILPKGRFTSHQYMESLVVAQLPLWKEMLGEQWAPSEVWFHHKAIAPIDTYAKAFGCDVRFGMSSNAIVAPAIDLDRRETPADIKVRTIVETMLVEELRCAELCFLEEVRTALKSLIPAQTATIQEVAHAVQMEPAALAARLAENGQNLKGLMNEARLDLIATHASRGDLSSADLQHLLGFRDTASFNSFVRQNMRRIRATTVLAFAQPTASH